MAYGDRRYFFKASLKTATAPLNAQHETQGAHLSIVFATTIITDTANIVFRQL
jgi:hypothetical protein